MDINRSDLCRVAEAALHQLMKTLQAKSVVCYFHNKFAEYYWLFYKDGHFRYPWQMNGGLSHPGQEKRMTHRSEDEMGISYFEKIPQELSTNVLAGVSFVEREGIKHCIRLRITGPVVQEQPESSGESIVFLNYVDDNSFPTEIRAKELISLQLPALSNSLSALATKPRLDPEDAWRMRSAMLKFRRRLGGILVNEPSRLNLPGQILSGQTKEWGIQASGASDELYDLIVDQARKLIRPKNGAENVLCSLNLVNAENKVEIVKYWSKPTRIAKEFRWGIVDYVGHTGQIFLVNDVETYRKLIEAQGPDNSRPKYVEGNKDSRCELACPLIIQERVVGVLNLEANKSDAYDDSHVLMLFYFASSAVLAVRQTLLWKDLRVAAAQQHLISHLTTEAEIFAETLESTTSLGYEAAIWDFETGKSYGKEELTPRKDGYTDWVLKNKSAVALGDLRPEGNEIKFQCHQGYIDPQSGLFTDWSRLTTAPTTLNEKLKEITRNASDVQPPEVITSLGFPIFKVVTMDGKPLLSGVRAVLWVKSQRHFLSLLDDDSWCLSLLCRNASTALKVFEDTQRKLEAQVTQERVLDYHFGKHAVTIMESLNKDSQLFHPKKKNDLIVLNIDIRGSTRLGEGLAARGQSDSYVELIETYDHLARETVFKHGGVMDKTMGDGVMALFNVYQDDILSVVNPPTDPKGDAVACAFEIFDEFRKLVDENKRKNRWAIDPGNRLCLGAALTMGSGFIGSFYRTWGLDYTVLGDVANEAGKLAHKARAKDLEEYLKWWLGIGIDRSGENPIYELGKPGEDSPASRDVIESLVRRLRERPTGILVANFGFADIASRPEYEVYSLRSDPDPSNVARTLLLLRRDTTSAGPFA